MPSPTFLAFDLGAASGRAILGRLESGRLNITEVLRFSNVMLPVRGHLKWDIFRLIENIKKGLAMAVRDTQIDSFAVDTWGVDFGLLDKKGSILGLPFAYRDSFTLGAMEEFFSKMKRDRIYHLTGVQFLTFNSLFQIFAIKRNISSILDKAHDLLFMPDLFHYFLTGEKITEFTIATTSQLYNPQKKEWEDGLFEALGISKSLMQSVIQPGAFVGRLKKEISREIGGWDIQAVAVGSHDTASAVAAVPSHGQDWAFISSGTWSLMGIETENPIIDSLALRLNFTNEGGVEGTFRFLKNITGLWLLQRCREIWEKEKPLSYDQLMAMARKAKSFQFFIDPDWKGFLNPADMTEAIRKYCTQTGQEPPHSIEEFVRGICECLAMKYRSVLDEIRLIRTTPIRRIHLIGGGAKNRLLCQFTANATGLSVLAGPDEATSIGNLMMQARAHAHIQSLSQMREVVRRSFEVAVYEPVQTTEWEKAYERFQKITAEEFDDDKKDDKDETSF